MFLFIKCLILDSTPILLEIYSFAAVLILYQVVVTLESVHEIVKCDHSNERYWAILSFQWGRAVYYAVQDDIMTFWAFGSNTEVMKLLSSAY